MSPITLLSVLAFGAACVWAGFLMVRLRDWRLAVPSLFFALLAGQGLLHALDPGGSGPDGWREVPGLLAGGFALLAVAAVGRVVVIERRARREAAEFGAIIERTPEFVAIASADESIEYLNPAGRDMLGLQPEEDVRGRPWVDFHPHWAYELIATEARPAALRRGVWKGVSALLHRDGHEVPCLQTVLARTERGRDARYYIFMRDISDLPVTGRSLRNREARLRLLTRQIPAIVWTCDRELEIDSVFGAGLAAVGVQPSELIGRRVGADIEDGVERAVVVEGHYRALGMPVERQGAEVRRLETPPPPAWELSLRPFDFRWHGRWFRAFVHPLRDDGDEVVGTVGVALDIDDRRRAEQMALELRGRLERVREEERRSLARDIHDELGQVLTALRMELMGGLESLPGDDPEGVIRAAAHVELVDEALAQVRRLSQRLRPPELDDLGLLEAVRSEIETFSRRARIPCDLESDVENLAPHFDRDTALFRILRESLTNVARHAGASRVDVRLRRTNGSLHLGVYDDGCGIRAPFGHDTLGLVGMSERARALGGSLAVTPRVDGGTAVTAELPVEPVEGA